MIMELAITRYVAVIKTQEYLLLNMLEIQHFAA